MTSRKFVSAFIDDISGRLLDNLYKLARDHSDKKTAEKVIKNIIKIVVKTGILYRNEQFNAVELTLADDFKKKFRHIAMTVVSFYTIDYTYDRAYLAAALDECADMLRRLVERHLTDKSLGRIDHVFKFFTNREFLDDVFRSGGGPHADVMGRIVEDLSHLIDNYII